MVCFCFTLKKSFKKKKKKENLLQLSSKQNYFPLIFSPAKLKSLLFAQFSSAVLIYKRQNCAVHGGARKRHLEPCQRAELEFIPSPRCAVMGRWWHPCAPCYTLLPFSLRKYTLTCSLTLYLNFKPLFLPSCQTVTNSLPSPIP